MTPLYVDGATPPRAASSTPGSAPRPDAAAAARARVTTLSAQFTAQIQQSMLESLSQMGAEEETDSGGDAEGGGDAGFGDLSALMPMDATTGATAASGSLATAGAGTEAQLARQLLAAIQEAANPAGIGSVGAAGGAAGAAATQAVGSYAPASTTTRGNAATVAQVAKEVGVDPVAAVAMMLVESGGNARAVGDGGTSFGLFQLHKGGMLTAAGLTPDQAFDPATNARVSLKSLAHEWAKGSARRTPGEIAAASQRPADPAGYARKVDAMMDRARSILGAG